MTEPTPAAEPQKFVSGRRALLGGGVTVAAAAALAACGKTSSSTAGAAGAVKELAGKKIIFVVHEKNAFFPPVQKGFENFGKAMGWKTQFMGPPTFEVSAVVNMMESAISAKPDGLILTRVDTTSYDATIKKALDAGIPVILSNVASDGYEELGVGFVGQDFVPAGVSAGKAFLDALSAKGIKEGAVIITTIQEGNSALEQRGQGIKQAIDDYNKANGSKFTTETLFVGTDEAAAVAKIGDRYTKDKNIAGFAGTAFECQFVATFAKTKNLVGKFANGGFDLNSPVLDGIKAGTIDYTIGQNPYGQGWVASALLAQQIYPGYPSFHYDTGAEVVDSTNIAAVMKREAAFA